MFKRFSSLDFSPKLFSSLKTYTKKDFYADLMSGIIVGIVALPLAIAFGIASGVSPEKGIITAIIAGFIISFFGGSKFQIGGPTGAFIVIVYGIVQEFGTTGLAIATLMAGVMLVFMGVFKIGSVIKFIPYPVVVGFTSGIALTIFTSQMKDFFGLEIEKLSGDFLHKWLQYFQAIDTINWISIILAILSILIIIYTPKISKKIPGSLIAIIVITLIAYFLKQIFPSIGIETIGDRFTIQASLPSPETPAINFDVIQTLLPVAFTIAMLGAIESLLSAMVADGVTGDKHHPNTELIAQGFANIITPIFGGIPATGAIARTMTNINNGGKTPIAGIIHAVVLLLIMLFLGSLTKHIPMACLAGVLIIVAYNMSEWRTFKILLKGPKSDVIVLLITFFLTVIFDLVIAIEVGLLMAILLFLKRVTETTHITVIENEIVNSELDEELDASDTEKLIIPEGVEVYEINGPFFFGVASKFDEQIKIMAEKPIVRIIRMRKVSFIDSTGLHNLKNIYQLSKKEGIHLILSGVNKEVYSTFKNTSFLTEIGEENVSDNIYEALDKSLLYIEKRKKYGKSI